MRPPVRLPIPVLALAVSIGSWSCGGQADAPQRPVPSSDQLVVWLSSACPCGTEPDDVIPRADLVKLCTVGAFDDASLGRLAMLDLGGDAIPQDALPLRAMYRAMDDGLASGEKLRLTTARRRLDLGRTLLLFTDDSVQDRGVLYVVDEATGRVCCKSYVDTAVHVVSR